MRVYNLTDVPTPTLERYSLLNQQIVAHRRIIEPGQFVEVEDTPTMRERLSHVLTVGAVSIDQLPPAYIRAKQLQAPQTGTFGSLPVRHVEVQETPVVGEPKSVVAPTTDRPVVLKGRRKDRP
jgi:hypothetical protein